MEKLPETPPPKTPQVHPENSTEMEMITPPKTPDVQKENNAEVEFNTPPITSKEKSVGDSPSSGKENLCKVNSIPDRLKVPKAFKYPERYTSPTDLMMSPVTKGLLARNRKGGALLPPSINQTKIQELRVQDVSLPHK